MNVNLWIRPGGLATRLAPLFDVDLLSLVPRHSEWLLYVHVLGSRVFLALDTSRSEATAWLAVLLPPAEAALRALRAES